MALYRVYLVNSVGTSVTVEADSPEAAADKVWESDGFQNLGGLCFQCEGQVGALGDWEIAGERDDKPEIELAE
jgi:hypothetical protein